MKPLVMITGAGNRIGAATARAFSNAGHPLLLLGHRFDNLAALELPQTLCVSADLRDHAAIDAAIDRGEAVYGPVDCLVNNAAAQLPSHAAALAADHAGGAASAGLESSAQAHLDAAADAVANCMHALIPAMKARRRGTIVNIQPVAGRRARDAQQPEPAVPRLLHGLSQAARCSLAEHEVRIVVVSPSLADEPHLATRGNSAGSPANGWPGEHRLEAGIAAEHVASTVLFAYQMPQGVTVQALAITPTRQTY